MAIKSESKRLSPHIAVKALSYEHNMEMCEKIAKYLEIEDDGDGSAADFVRYQFERIWKDELAAALERRAEKLKEPCYKPPEGQQ